ncbi:MAG: HAD family phosphatase [Desulfitobacterium sp.]|nr:HAD family phosphatase [Desulfitobacterium sp.]
MNIKLVATDLDDTLLRDDLTISPRVIETVRKAKAQGVIVTFATGRMPASTRPYAEQLGIDVPIITYNGAMVQEAISQEVLLRKVIPLELAHDIISYLLKDEVIFHMYLRDQIFVPKMNKWSEEYAQRVNVPVEEGNLLQLLEKEEEGIEKLILFDEPESLTKWANIVRDRFPDQFHLTSSKPYFLELMHPEVNKGRTLLSFAADMGIKSEEVMAIGDGLNDLEMISSVGLGVAVANAREEVKAVAKFITTSNEEDGVAEAIEKYVLRSS